jgi:hypothetical protein
VLVPEAPVDEDDRPVFREDDIRVAGQVFAMQAEAIPQPVQQAPDDEFRLRVPAADTRHVPASSIGRAAIH